MNKYVLLILKWLKNPESITRKELDEHYDSLSYPNFHSSPEFAIECAFDNLYLSTSDNTEEWINEYFRISGESRDDYEKALFT